MNKGIVMEIVTNNVIVMTPDGQFKKVAKPSRTCQIGEEIQFSAPGFGWLRPSFKMASTAVAAVLLCVVVLSALGGLGGGQTVAAYVTIDINPSIELGIDAKEEVVEARGLNDDGELLIKELVYKGESIGTVTETLMERVEQGGYLADGQGDILITSTLVQEDADINEQQIAEQLEVRVKAFVKKKHPNANENIQVAKLSAPKEMREEAISEGVSTGKLAIRLIMNKAIEKNKGEPIPPELFEKHSIHELARELGGLGKLINADIPVTKEELKQLLKEKKKKDPKQGNKGQGNKGRIDIDPDLSPGSSDEDGKDEGKHKDEGKGKGKGKDDIGKNNKGENNDRPKGDDEQARDPKKNGSAESPDRANNGRDKDPGNNGKSGRGIPKDKEPSGVPLSPDDSLPSGDVVDEDELPDMGSDEDKHSGKKGIPGSGRKDKEEQEGMRKGKPDSGNDDENDEDNDDGKIEADEKGHRKKYQSWNRGFKRKEARSESNSTAPAPTGLLNPGIFLKNYD